MVLDDPDSRDSRHRTNPGFRRLTCPSPITRVTVADADLRSNSSAHGDRTPSHPFLWNSGMCGMRLSFPASDQAAAECNMLPATRFYYFYYLFSANILMDERLGLRLYSSVSLATPFTCFYPILLHCLLTLTQIISNSFLSAKVVAAVCCEIRHRLFQLYMRVLTEVLFWKYYIRKEEVVPF